MPHRSNRSCKKATQRALSSGEMQDGLKRKKTLEAKQAQPQSALGRENSERYTKTNYNIFLSGTESYSELDIQGH